jgi:hypothetical protein
MYLLILAAALVGGVPGQSGVIEQRPIVTPGPPLPAAPPRNVITDPMFAAAPIRELRRAWDDCTWGMTQTMLVNGRSEDEAAQWVFAGCADEESKLTGALVRKFGFKAGNEAIDRAKRQLRDKLRDEYSKNARAAEGAGIIGSAGGWKLKRLASGGCAALYGDEDFLGNTKQVIGLTRLSSSPARYLLTLGFIPDERTGTDLPPMADVLLRAEVSSNEIVVHPLDAQMRTSQTRQGDPFISIITLLDETAVDQLASISVLWVQAGPGLNPPPYHPGGLHAAAELLQQCGDMLG